MKFIAYIAGITVGIAGAFGLWVGTIRLLVPQGQGLDFIKQELTMLALLPVFLLVGAIAGARITRWYVSPPSPERPISRSPQLSSILFSDPVQDGDEDAGLPIEERLRRFRERDSR